MTDETRADETAIDPAALPPPALLPPAALAALLAAGPAGVLVIDLRAAPAFEAGHPPGAVRSDYAADGWRAAGGGAPGLLPPPDRLAALLGGLGLTPARRAVVVQAGPAASDLAGAARVVWTLKAAGHARAHLLDGGFPAWAADPARPVETGPARPRPSPPYPVALDAGLRATPEQVAEALAAGGALLDARDAPHATGEAKAPAAQRPGRLPGALHRDAADLVDPATGRLRPPEALAALFARVPAGPVVSYCNTGHSAALTWFALSEVLGREGARLYDGSMSQWTQDPARPVETGPVAGA